MTRAWVGGMVAVAALAVLIIAFAFTTSPNTIVLKADGFHPRTLTISASTTVTFKNESGKYFWPASDFHPTHALYPSFDALTPLAPGSSYEYTFSDPGTYPFHDHLAAYFFGLIEVADDAGAVPDDCVARGKFSCWQNELFATLVKDGLDATYDRIAELYESDPAFAGSCHSLAHNIGLASYQLYLEDPSLVESPKAVACASGFYHGFMEGFIGASGNLEEAVAICEAVGVSLTEESPDARYQCYHGIGHGAMETAVAQSGEFGSLDDMVLSAVQLCEQTSEGAEERYRCVSGAYNAIANFYIIGAYGLSSEEGEAFDLCSRQSASYQEACYGNMNSVAMWLVDDEFDAAAPYILSIKDETHIPKSIEYLSGMNALQYLDGGSFDSVVRSCQALPEAYESPCVIGFAHGLLEHGAPGKEYVEALRFCATESLTDSLADACYQKALALSGWYSKEKASTICAGLPTEIQHFCAE